MTARQGLESYQQVFHTSKCELFTNAAIYHGYVGYVALSILYYVT